MPPVVFDYINKVQRRLEQKLEYLRVEARYTRREKRDSRFVSDAVYQDGEYHYKPVQRPVSEPVACGYSATCSANIHRSQGRQSTKSKFDRRTTRSHSRTPHNVPGPAGRRKSPAVPERNEDHQTIENASGPKRVVEKDESEATQQTLLDDKQDTDEVEEKAAGQVETEERAKDRHEREQELEKDLVADIKIDARHTLRQFEDMPSSGVNRRRSMLAMRSQKDHQHSMMSTRSPEFGAPTASYWESDSAKTRPTSLRRSSTMSRQDRRSSLHGIRELMARSSSTDGSRSKRTLHTPEPGQQAGLTGVQEKRSTLYGIREFMSRLD